MQLTVTCTLDGCGNVGVPITVDLPDDDPAVLVVCGPCGSELATRP